MADYAAGEQEFVRSGLLADGAASGGVPVETGAQLGGLSQGRKPTRRTSAGEGVALPMGCFVRRVHNQQAVVRAGGPKKRFNLGSQLACMRPECFRPRWRLRYIAEPLLRKLQ